MTTNCNACKYFCSEVSTASGDCRRNAPKRVHGVGTGSDEVLWPEVKQIDWCGEFATDEDTQKAAQLLHEPRLDIQAACLHDWQPLLKEQCTKCGKVIS